MYICLATLVTKLTIKPFSLFQQLNFWVHHSPLEGCVVASWRAYHQSDLMLCNVCAKHQSNIGGKLQLATPCWFQCDWNSGWPTIFNTSGAETEIIRSIPWLLMTWLLASPVHQQPWHWLCRMNGSLSSTRKYFKSLCHIIVEKSLQTQKHFCFLI